MTDAPTDKYLEALRRFADAGDLKMARSVARSMEQREVPLGPGHLELLLRANLAGRDAPGARQVVERMRAAGMEVDSTVRFDLAITTARSGRLADAVGELDTLHQEGLRPASGQLQELVTIHVRAGRFPAARALLRRLAAEGRGARPQDYEAMFADLHERRAIKDSIAQVETMLEAGTPPTPAQAEGLVRMMAEAGHPDRATELLDMLLAADVLSNQEVLTAILDGHARAGDAEAVAATVQRMAEAGVEPNSFHRNQMLAARLVANDVDGAWRMADQLVEHGRIPSGDNLDALFDVTLEAGNLRRASGVIDWALMLGVPVAPQRVAAAVDGHLQAGELTTARWLFDETARHGVPRDRRAARGIVEETIRSGDLDGARALLSELLATQTLTHGRHWGSMLRALLGADRVADAVAVVGELIAAGQAPAAGDLVRIVHALLDAKEPAAALDLSLGSLRAGAELDATNFGELLWLFAKPKHVEQTEAIHAWMVEHGIEVEHRHAKAVAHARGEELPDPEPTPEPATPSPVVEEAATGDAAPTSPHEPADWELQIEGAVTATPPTPESATPESAPEPAPPAGTPDPAPAEMEGAGPDEAVEAALVEAATGDPVTAVVDEPSDGPTGPGGEVAEPTDAEEAAGSTPGGVDEEAPADQHLEAEQAQVEQDEQDEQDEPSEQDEQSA